MRSKIVAATPMLSLITFLLLGFCFGLWHPGWLVFLLIPVMPFLLGLKKLSNIYPTITAVVYLIIGFAFGWWHPGWIIFLTIPVVEIFCSKNKDDEDTDETA